MNTILILLRLLPFDYWINFSLSPSNLVSGDTFRAGIRTSVDVDNFHQTKPAAALGPCQIITQINPSSRKYQVSCKGWVLSPFFGSSLLWACHDNCLCNHLSQAEDDVGLASRPISASILPMSAQPDLTSYMQVISPGIFFRSIESLWMLIKNKAFWAINGKK